MHIEEKIAQMLMIGFEGSILDKNNPIVADIINRKLGSVILFDRDTKTLAMGKKNIENPAQLKKLTQQLQNYADHSLLIATDYEGGDQQLQNKRGPGVNRLNEAYGFPYTCCAKEFAELPAKEALSMAKTMAQTAKEAGINVIFAPVVDVVKFPGKSMIDLRGRAFSSNVDTVIKCASLFIEAYTQENIACCLKHFPGLGSSIADVHDTSSDVTNTWELSELKPYENLGSKVDMIMTTHVSNRRLDDSDLPATFSKRILQNLLRMQLGFKGLIVADDLQMKAATLKRDLKDIIEAAVNAGCDILPFGNMLHYQPDITHRAINFMLQLLEDEKITEERINQSYQRIRALKLKLGLCRREGN